MLKPDASLDLAALATAYRDGALTPSALVEGLLARLAARGEDRVWISRVPDRTLRSMAKALEAEGPAGKPLYGIPFAIKDNIDLAGLPTTAACAEFAYEPGRSATVVARLVKAGAIPLGKTNLDQFATGLNGTRSPYGVPECALKPGYIPGGSSSGSAVAVAAGLVSFALGTDTAGSGRVPAMFNNLVGLKPTKGLLSTFGVVPACRSLDCVSIFALSADDARDVLAVAKGFDRDDPYSRHEAPAVLPATIAGTRFGVPRPGQREFFGNGEGARLFEAALGRLEALGGELVEIDLEPFLEAARLLYDGPWVAERYVAIRDFLARKPDAVFPVTRAIIEAGARPSAAEAFAGAYRLEGLRRLTGAAWDRMDVLVTPTAGRQYTIAEMQADPVRLNSNLGRYTNFINLLDLAAVAVPAGFQADGLAFGITLIGPAFSDVGLLRLADAFHRDEALPIGAGRHALPAPRPVPVPATTVRVAVCGAHMAGLPLNWQLTDRGGHLVRRCRTAPQYRLFALPGGPPARPGMVRAADGRAIEVEVWELPVTAFGSFVAAIPPPLGIGSVELDDGAWVKGFICEGYGTIDARDITELGGWRRYIAEAQREPAPT